MNCGVVMSADKGCVNRMSVNRVCDDGNMTSRWEMGDGGTYLWQGGSFHGPHPLLVVWGWSKWLPPTDLQLKPETTSSPCR